MTKYVTLLLTGMLLCSRLMAQYNAPQNKYWVFGAGGGIDFSTGTPVPASSNIYTHEGTASVCDTGGHLLFYTDGDTVWTKTGSIMPHGASIISFSTISSSQGALIMPRTAYPGQYYVFSKEELWEPNNGKLVYCIVDMSLNGGLGDVIAATKETLIDSFFSEKMIAVPGNPGSFWLLTMRNDTNLFYAYNVNAAGINPVPVISEAGSESGYCTFGMKCSQNGTKLAVVLGPSLWPDGRGIELYDFNPATGAVSNFRLLNSTDYYYGCEFSPDNTKLYAQKSDPTAVIYQYDITLPSAAGIIASMQEVAASSYNIYTDMRLAPDGKIYFKSLDAAFTNSHFLDCIATPNAAASLCGYTSHAIYMPAGEMIYGLPNPTWKINYVPAAVQPAMREANVSVYPNPAHDELNIESAGPVSSVVITDVLGKVVYSSAGQARKLNIAHLQPGIYMLLLNGNRRARFVKE